MQMSIKTLPCGFRSANGFVPRFGTRTTRTKPILLLDIVNVALRLVGLRGVPTVVDFPVRDVKVVEVEGVEVVVRASRR